MEDKQTTKLSEQDPEEFFYLTLDSLYIRKDKRKAFIAANLNKVTKHLRCENCYQIRKLNFYEQWNMKLCKSCYQIMRTEAKKDI